MLKLSSPRRKAAAILLLITIIGGACPVLSKMAMEEIPPLSFTFIRFLIASLCILPFFIATKPKLTKKSYKVILFSLFLALNSVLFPIGLALTTASIASMLFVVSPLIVALLSYLFLAERFNFDKWTGLIVGFIGSILIILLPVITNNAPFSGDIVGNILVLYLQPVFLSTRFFPNHFSGDTHRYN